MNLILQVGTQADLPPVPPGKFAFSFAHIIDQSEVRNKRESTKCLYFDRLQFARKSIEIFYFPLLQ